MNWGVNFAQFFIDGPIPPSLLLFHCLYYLKSMSSLLLLKTEVKSRRFLESDLTNFPVACSLREAAAARCWGTQQTSAGGENVSGCQQLVFGDSHFHLKLIFPHKLVDQIIIL